MEATALDSAPIAATDETRPWFRGAIAAWCIPDLALVAAWVTLFYCLFLFQGTQTLFRDSDAGWHIRSGEAILETGTLPHSDPYSFTMAGRPWFAWEWGADVVTGAVHRAAGLTGVALLYGVVIAAGVWLWLRLHWVVGGNFLLAAALLPLALSTCNIHWLARPHVWGWCFAIVALREVEFAQQRFRWRDGARIGVGMALWANVHASFFLGPLMALLYAGGHWVRPLLWDLGRCVEWRRARWSAAAAAVGALATLANPYGWNLHAHVARYLGDSALLSRIGEYQSFDFHAPGTGQILAAVLIAAAGGVLALGQKHVGRFALSALVVAAGLRSARALPLVALLLLPLANAGITQALRTSMGLRQSVRRGFDRFLRYSENLRRIDAGCHGAAVAWIVPLLCFSLLKTPAIAARTGFSPEAFPVQAYAAVERLPASARLFAPDKYGGYLIYRSRGTRPVFIDGRSDLYGADFLVRYARMVQVRPGWQRIWDGFRFTQALLPCDYSLVPALEAAGWRETYRDRTAVLLTAPAGTLAAGGTK
jgi:hypothetical protein